MELTLSEASAHLGYRSTTVLGRLRRSGLLRDYEVNRSGGPYLLEAYPAGRAPLRDHVAALIQLRHDSPLAQRHPAAPAVADGTALDAAMDAIDTGLAAAGWAEASPDWPAIAEQLNTYLGPEWPAPPWDGSQAATVAMCLALAQEAVDG